MVEIFENIRKIYTFEKPCPDLAEHIEFFSESSFEDTKKYITGEYFSVKMFPSWTPTFYINLGPPYKISVSEKCHSINSDEDILILRNTNVERFNSISDNIFTVKFYPGGLEAVLNINQSLMFDKIVNLDKILPIQLLNQVKKQISFNERVILFQDFFLANYKKKQDHYLKFVSDTIDVYVGADMQFSNSMLAEKMFTTSKTINRYFHRVVGTSPKNYLSIARARRALTDYVNNGTSFVPFDYGYYDMSHFYKDIVNFTGQKLSANSF